MRTSSAVAYPVMSAGPDWITATSKNGSRSLLAEALAAEVLDNERASNRDVVAGSRLGYAGYACSGFFFGRRPDGVLTIASGPACAPLAQQLISTASNVSRLDLQITLDTSFDAPHLGAMHFKKLRNERRKNHRPGHLRLISGHPHGETFYLNKRTSDSMGRCYDKASENNDGPPRTIWRYEVEFKRRQAWRYAKALRDSETPAIWTCSQVRQWYLERSVECPADFATSVDYCQPADESRSTDVLSWFEDSVSVTIAKSIKKHGLNLTLRKLRLDHLVQPVAIVAMEVQHDDKTFSPDFEAELPQSALSERILVSKAH